jgi:hypothetical protein
MFIAATSSRSCPCHGPVVCWFTARSKLRRPRGGSLATSIRTRDGATCRKVSQTNTVIQEIRRGAQWTRTCAAVLKVTKTVLRAKRMHSAGHRSKTTRTNSSLAMWPVTEAPLRNRTAMQYAAGVLQGPELIRSSASLQKQVSHLQL